jgi:hypothetical protein
MGQMTPEYTSQWWRKTRITAWRQEHSLAVRDVLFFILFIYFCCLFCSSENKLPGSLQSSNYKFTQRKQDMGRVETCKWNDRSRLNCCTPAPHKITGARMRFRKAVALLTPHLLLERPPREHKGFRELTQLALIVHYGVK